MNEKTKRPPQWRMKDDGTVWSEVGRPTENEVYLSGPLPCRGMRSVHREVLLRDYEEVREARSPGGVAGVYVRLWDAVNAVVSASGGNAGSTSVARQVAVAAFDRVLADFAREYVLLAGNASLREIADVERLYDKTRHRKFATEIAMLRQRVERRLGEVQSKCREWLKSSAVPAFDFVSFVDEKSKWSIDTFGPGDRYAGVIEHIRRELKEIEESPSDLVEWVDVIFLAMDGAMRSAGADGAALVEAMMAKHTKNTLREWPDWRTLQPGEVSQHIKTSEGDNS